MYLHRIPRWFSGLWPSLQWEGPAPHLYLTFDDGPIPEVTPWVLDTLAEAGVKATFFCVGDNARKHPHILERIKAEGHRVGNHTMHHVSGWGTPLAKYEAEVALAQDWLNTPAGEPRLFRPPYGRIGRKQRKGLQQDFRIVMWTVLTADYDRRLSPKACLRASIKATQPGSIVVFHDSLKAERNLRYVLPRYLQDCQAQGYSFATL